MAAHALLPTWAYGIAGISWALFALAAPRLTKQAGLAAALAEARPGEKRGLLICAVAAAIWLALLPLSPYPSQHNIGMGDAPAYYVAARNLARGLPLEHGVFTGDYMGGQLPYLRAQPLLVYAASLLMQLAGFSLTGLHVLLLLSGALALYAAAELAMGEKRSAWSLPLATAIFVMLPGHFIFFGAGILAAPPLLAAICLYILTLAERLSARQRSLGAVVCVSVMLLSRPETAILATVFVACLLLRTIWRTLGTIKAIGALAIAALTVISLGESLPCHLPARICGPIENLSLFHMRFDPRLQQFRSADLWWQNHRAFCAVAFANSDTHAPRPGPQLFADICAHPGAFLAYSAHALWARSSSIARAMLGPLWPTGESRWFLWNTISFFIWLTVFLLAAPGHLHLVASIGIFMLTMPVLNAGISDRHWIVATILLLALAARAMRRVGTTSSGATDDKDRHADFATAPFPRRYLLLFICGVMCLVIETVWLAQIRVEKYNTLHVPVIAAIKRHVPARATVVCTWPPLIACCTDRSAVGCTWLCENLPAVLAKYH
ncbi:MAG: hypothetical protein N3A66_08175, partial [Planctomycetota bacterium]|nr:hypothetical protein [Planctomycetota bacterium]